MTKFQKWLVLLPLLILLLFFSNPVVAHPGRTDSSGGHTCYTNCEKWGYDYGEYHYHGGYSAPNYTPPQQPTIDWNLDTSEPVTPVVEADEPSDLEEEPEPEEDNSLGWILGVGFVGLVAYGALKKD